MSRRGIGGLCLSPRRSLLQSAPMSSGGPFAELVHAHRVDDALARNSGCIRGEPLRELRIVHLRCDDIALNHTLLISYFAICVLSNTTDRAGVPANDRCRCCVVVDALFGPI